MAGRFVRFTLVLTVFLGSHGWANNLITNSTFATADLSTWSTFVVGTGATMAFVTGAQSTTGPLNPDGAGSAGFQHTSAVNFVSGIYKTVTVTPSVSYDLSMIGQVVSSSAQNVFADFGDDNLYLFWVDGTGTGFTTTWPSEATVLDSEVSDDAAAQAWKPLTGTFTPNVSTIIVGAAVSFVNGISVTDSCVVDEFKLKVSGTNIWEINFNGGSVPSTPPGISDPLRKSTDNTGTAGAYPQFVSDAGAQVPVGAEGYLDFFDNQTGSKFDEFQPAQAIYPAGAGTILMRARRVVGDGGDGGTGTDILQLWDVTCSDQAALRMVDTGGGWGVQLRAGATSNVFVGASNTWHTVRITWQNDTNHVRWTVYVDGNTTPAGTLLGTDNSLAGLPFGRFKTSSSTSSRASYDLDWLLVTTEGAFLPGTGPALPLGFGEPTPADVQSWDLY